MTDTPAEPLRPESLEEIAPLAELCTMGRLFEVQEWIKKGKPVNLPLRRKSGSKTRSPLEIAIDLGFHSLVQVLLEGGAKQESFGYESPMVRALRTRRMDIAQLLVDNGFDPKQVNMDSVFETWDPKIMSYFIENGADLVTYNHFAKAFCNRIRTALRVFKECKESLPELQEQANIALRHHCREGNLKWVSLMLWLGADPNIPGTDNPDDDPEISQPHGQENAQDQKEDDDEDQDQDQDNDEVKLTALEYAALNGHYQIFDLKPIRTASNPPTTGRLLRYLTMGQGAEVLKKLLEKGMNPNDQKNGGCSAIPYALQMMAWRNPFSYSYSWKIDAQKEKLDNSEARNCLKAIHILAKHKAQWKPKYTGELNSARRSLLNMKAEYTVEFVWIMTKFNGCDRADLNNLLRTPTMKNHLGTFLKKVNQMIRDWE